MRRIELFEVSVTYKLIPSVVMPLGKLNLAAVPVLSADPDVPAVPARVVTAPVKSTIFRIV
jgi:hypothetical protein